MSESERQRRRHAAMACQKALHMEMRQVRTKLDWTRDWAWIEARSLGIVVFVAIGLAVAATFSFATGKGEAGAILAVLAAACGYPIGDSITGLRLAWADVAAEEERTREFMARDFFEIQDVGLWLKVETDLNERWADSV